MTQDILDYSTPGKQDPRSFAASTNKRFVNFLLDWACFFLTLFLLSFFLLNIALNPKIITVLADAIFIISIPSYWILFEYFLGGRTPAKYFTQTKVITKYGNKPGFWNIVGRTLCRFIPFEPFSFLGSNVGWHDSISGDVGGGGGVWEGGVCVRGGGWESC